MSDYLMRVALSGARTSPPARPPAAGPPRLPEVGLAARQATDTPPVAGAAPPEAQPVPEVAAPRQTASEPASPAAPLVLGSGERTAPPTRVADADPPTVSTAAPSGGEAVPLIRMPRALRPTPAQFEERAAPLPTTPQPGPAPATELVTPSRLETGRRPEGPASPVPPDAVSARTEAPVRKGADPGKGEGPLAEEPPVTLAPVPPPAAGPLPPPLDRGADARPEGDTPQVTGKPAASRAADRAELKRAEVITPAKAETELSVFPLPEPPVQVPPTGPVAGAASLPGEGGTRQARVVIGRLEVQVNNHPPAPPAIVPPRAAGPLPVDALEQRCLDRFRLRP
jgi:hypothetical protein